MPNAVIESFSRERTCSGAKLLTGTDGDWAVSVRCKRARAAIKMGAVDRLRLLGPLGMIMRTQDSPFSAELRGVTTRARPDKETGRPRVEPGPRRSLHPTARRRSGDQSDGVQAFNTLVSRSGKTGRIGCQGSDWNSKLRLRQTLTGSSLFLRPAQYGF
jgi:hypothetical protein